MMSMAVPWNVKDVLANLPIPQDGMSHSFCYALARFKQKGTIFSFGNPDYKQTSEKHNHVLDEDIQHDHFSEELVSIA